MLNKELTIHSLGAVNLKTRFSLKCHEIISSKSGVNKLLCVMPVMISKKNKKQNTTVVLHHQFSCSLIGQYLYILMSIGRNNVFMLCVSARTKFAPLLY